MEFRSARNTDRGGQEGKEKGATERVERRNRGLWPRHDAIFRPVARDPGRRHSRGGATGTAWRVSRRPAHTYLRVPSIARIVQNHAPTIAGPQCTAVACENCGWGKRAFRAITRPAELYKLRGAMAGRILSRAADANGTRIRFRALCEPPQHFSRLRGRRLNGSTNDELKARRETALPIVERGAAAPSAARESHNGDARAFKLFGRMRLNPW